jgi:hypothetical protein
MKNKEKKGGKMRSKLNGGKSILLGRRSFLKLGFISLALPFGSSLSSALKMDKIDHESPDGSFIILEWYRESDFLASK